VNGIVHVTGGGLIENPPRVYNDTLAFALDCAAAPLPPVFGWLRDQGRMELFELARTFNCGIGLIIYVEADKANVVLQALKNGPEPHALMIGKLVSRNGGDAVILENSDHWLGQA
jgi:phosphoribosylformylglycinamidine cyclo-ligase